MVKTIHTDYHGDRAIIYRPHESNLIFIDGDFGEDKIVWRGIYDAEGARKIANRLNRLADLIEGKSV